MKKPIITAIGTMSGTSCDGIDIALIKTDGEKHIECLNTAFFQYPKQFSSRILELMSSDSNIQTLRLESELTRFHAETINNFLPNISITPKEVDVIGFHGQTIIHLPAEGLTQQIGNPHLLAELVGIDVIYDFRRRDMASGGQGAPLTPIFHQALAHKFALDKVIFLNIGGIANITCIDPKSSKAFDIGPGNALLNDLLKKRMGLEYDEDGIIAARGKVNDEALDVIMSDPFFYDPPPKSLDRVHFDRYHSVLDQLSTEDAAATLSKVIALSLKRALKYIGKCDFILLCGGGRKNLTIKRLIQEEFEASIQVKSIDELGIDGCFIEAYAFGYLAARSLLGKPLSVPEFTGVKKPMIGGSIVKYS